MSQSPAPNTYSLPSTANPKNITLSGRHDILYKNEYPSPTAYTLSSTLNTTKASTLASRTNQIIKAKSPGPTAYYPVKQGRSSSPTLGTRTAYPGTLDWDLKSRISNTSQNFYDIQSKRSTISSSFGKRVTLKSDETGPGPAKYSNRDVNINVIRPQSPSYTLRGRMRNIEFENTLKNSNVGPASYNVSGRNSRGKDSISKNQSISLKGRPTNRGIMVFV
ncbi:SHIPPO 1-like protein [Spironucleus salmonicida]|uniref:SHIPPO 1-like protein n=1 Tax=Spironucleus salmonicida TaxID=348837 RepID=V6LJQ6_9EUKA|nr:SHIPPO 1-like protein [Spironucleus salmonicida]|eukprot:EST43951.1 SHIPPO 1-like protein [Spironucleus salmonicida]